MTRPRLALRSLTAAGALLGLAGCVTSSSLTQRSVEEEGRQQVSAEPHAPGAWATIGESRDGRPVRALSLGVGREQLRSTARLALIAGIHGDEREGGRHLDEILTLLSRQGSWQVRVYEDVNPDGTWRGTRGTTTGVDPNRNWPARNFQPSRQRGPRPLSEPGVAAVHADLVEFDPALVIVLHSARTGPFVNFDGPARPWAETFADAASSATEASWPVRPSMGYPTPGSLGSWMGVDREIPILTIEFARGCSTLASGPPLLAGLQAIVNNGPVRPSETFRVR